MSGEKLSLGAPSENVHYNVLQCNELTRLKWAALVMYNLVGIGIAKVHSPTRCQSGIRSLDCGLVARVRMSLGIGST